MHLYLDLGSKKRPKKKMKFLALVIYSEKVFNCNLKKLSEITARNVTKTNTQY